MKNKKTIALAMAAATVAPMAVPVFAAEIVGNVNYDFNLDDLKAENDQIRVKAEKDLEVTVSAIKKLVSKTDSNGNKVYKVEKVERVEEKTVEGFTYKYSYIYVTLTPQDDVTLSDTETEMFTFYRKMVDQGFGQELEAQRVKSDINTKKGRAELSKMIYEINKNIAKITPVYDKDSQIISIYAGKAGLEQIESGEEILLAEISLIGDKDKLDKIVLVDAENDFLGHWAENTIVDAMIAGIVDNTAKFNPEQEITRAQFAKMICEANDIDAIEYTQENKAKFDKFTDVSVTEWYAGYVAAIAEKGLMNGDGNKIFRPEDKISRQEVAVVLATLTNKEQGKYVSREQVTTDVNGNRVHKDTKTNFADDVNIAVWADESVEYLRENEIAKGYEVSKGKFEYRPVNNMSRAEALTMITRVSK